MTVEIVPGNPAAIDIVALIRESDAYYARLYPTESSHLLDVEALKKPEVSFFAARHGTQLLGLGSLVRQNGYGEIRRMYVKPEARGAGTGRRLLVRLETQAAAFGLVLIRLETGICNPKRLRSTEATGMRRSVRSGTIRPMR